MTSTQSNENQMTEFRKLKFNSVTVESSLVSFFKENSFVKVTNALDSASAQTIYDHIKHQQEWNLVFDLDGKHQDYNSQDVAQWSPSQKQQLQEIIYQQAAVGFQYHYETIPLYDIYKSNRLPGHFFNKIIEFLNDEETLNYFRALLQEPNIKFADGQITRFKPNHFLNTHNDEVQHKNRIAAYVINLTPVWMPNWGGALHILDEQGQIRQSYLPSFNEINIFKIPVDHYVGFVSPFANAPRLSITGWLRG